jgi:hypothetical protein
MNLTLNKETAIRAVRLISARPWRHYCYSTRCGCILLIKMRHKKRCSQAAASYRTHDLTPQNYILFFIPTSFYLFFYNFLKIRCNRRTHVYHSIFRGCTTNYHHSTIQTLTELAPLAVVQGRKHFGCKYIKIFLT